MRLECIWVKFVFIKLKLLVEILVILKWSEEGSSAESNGGSGSDGGGTGELGGQAFLGVVPGVLISTEHVGVSDNFISRFVSGDVKVSLGLSRLEPSSGELLTLVESLNDGLGLGAGTILL